MWFEKISEKIGHVIHVIPKVYDWGEEHPLVIHIICVMCNLKS